MDRTDVIALFVKAVDTGSLSAAARSLGLSPPSIGTRLVIRTTRSLSLSEAGRVYYEHAKQMLADLDAVEASLLADASVPAGTLSVRAPTLFGRVFVLPLLARFLVDNPRVALDVTLLDRDFNLVEEGIDLAVRIGPLKDSSLIVRLLTWSAAASRAAPRISGTTIAWCSPSPVMGGASAKTAARSASKDRRGCTPMRLTRSLKPQSPAPVSSTRRPGRSASMLPRAGLRLYYAIMKWRRCRLTHC
jgi:DNA-binding transcriptional LysR family regulator